MNCCGDGLQAASVRYLGSDAPFSCRVRCRKSSPISSRFKWMAWHDDMAGRLLAELHDAFAEIGVVTSMPRASEVWMRWHSSVSIGFDLTRCVTP